MSAEPAARDRVPMIDLRVLVQIAVMWLVMGLSAMVNAAETARQQGVDLYGEQSRRIIAALEFQAQYLPPHKATPPPNVELNLHPTWEIAYNHYHNRMGVELPRMSAVLPTNRPTGVNHHMAWETLTHAGVGAVGLPPPKDR